MLRELRATALEPLVSWLPNLSSAPLRKMLEGVIDKLASANVNEVQRLLRQPDSPALAGVVALCGRLQLHHAVPGFTDIIAHPDKAIRLAVVQTLSQLGTPGALTLWTARSRIPIAEFGSPRSGVSVPEATRARSAGLKG